MERFQSKAKRDHPKTKPKSFDQRICELNAYVNGRIESRKYANIKAKLNELDGWLRNRLRYYIWHHWKKPERKRKNLIRLGVEIGQAYAWSRSNMGGMGNSLKSNIRHYRYRKSLQTKRLYSSPNSVCKENRYSCK